MSEKITEAELSTIVRLVSAMPRDAASVRALKDYAAMLVAEVRRLRGLISGLDPAPGGIEPEDRENCCFWCDCEFADPHVPECSFAAIADEARAIRDESRLTRDVEHA